MDNIYTISSLLTFIKKHLHVIVEESDFDMRLADPFC